MCMSVCLNMFYLQRTSQACMPGCIHTYVYSSVEEIQYHLNPNRDIGIENQNPRLWKGQNQKKRKLKRACDAQKLTGTVGDKSSIQRQFYGGENNFCPTRDEWFPKFPCLLVSLEARRDVG